MGVDDAGDFVDRGRRFVANVDDTTVQCPAKRELYGGGDVTVVDQAQALGGVPVPAAEQLPSNCGADCR